MTGQQSRPDVMAGAAQEMTPASEVSDQSLSEPPDVETVPQQLTRRRRASLRLPPLENGHRDPLDGLRGR